MGTSLRHAVPALGLLLLGPAIFRASADTEPIDALAAESSRVAAEIRSLRQELELAAGPDFYLVLDIRARRLRLLLAGVVLQEYDVQDLQVGTPRTLACRPGAPPTDWSQRLWSRGQLDPPRLLDRFELVADTSAHAGQPSDIPVPPTPEELYPAPGRFCVRYEGGLALEVVPVTSSGSEEPTRRRGGLGPALRRWAERFGLRARDAVRVRLFLPVEDAATLYRALPPETHLLLRS